jgi:hypothetical protein
MPDDRSTAVNRINPRMTCNARSLDLAVFRARKPGQDTTTRKENALPAIPRVSLSALQSDEI